MTRKKWGYSARFGDEDDWSAAKPIPYSRLFTVLASNMVVKATVELIDKLLTVHAKRTDAPDEESPADTHVDAIPIIERNALLADFMMLGLMEPSPRRHPIADKAEYWALSALGQDLLKSRKRAAFAADPAARESGGEAAPLLE